MTRTISGRSLPRQVLDAHAVMEPLIWKEWRESRWILLTGTLGLLAFIRVVMAGGEPHDLVGNVLKVIGTVFLPPLVMLVGLSVACRDLNSRLETFWGSRPIILEYFIGVKYAMGLMIALALVVVTVLPSVIVASYIQHLERSMSRTWGDSLINECVSVVPCLIILVALLYSTAFVIGVLVRDTAKAAIVSIAAALLILFLPMLLPALGWMSVYSLIDQQAVRHASYAPFPAQWPWLILGQRTSRGSFGVAVHMDFVRYLLMSIVLCAVCAVLAWAALRHRFRLAVDQKLVYWSLGGVALLLFGAASVQVGSNIEPSKTFAPLPEPDRVIIALAEHEGRGVMLTVPTKDRFMINDLVAVSIGTFDTRAAEPYGRMTELPVHGLYWLSYPQFAWDPGRPELVYLLAKDMHSVDRHRVETLRLVTARVDDRSANVIHELNLSALLPKGSLYFGRGGSAISLRDGQLHVLAGAGDVHNITIDLSAPHEPRVDRVWSDNRWGWSHFPGEREEVHYHQPTSGGSARASLDAMQPVWQYLWPYLDWNGEVLTVATRSGLATYAAHGVSSGRQAFRRVGHRGSTPLEQWGSSPSRLLRLGDFAWVQDGSHAPSATVFDLSNPREPRKIGHFARPGGRWHATTIMSDGRLLLATDRLYMFDPAEWERSSSAP